MKCSSVLSFLVERVRTFPMHRVYHLIDRYVFYGVVVDRGGGGSSVGNSSGSGRGISP